MNKIFILSGPSGSGKSTLIKLLTQKYDFLEFSVSHTTRRIRDGESESIEYYFVSREKFKKMISMNEFAEWAEVHGELYGTSLGEITTKSTGEKILILDIDVQGAEIIKNKFPDSMLVFVMPPGLDELKKRIKKREKELSSDFLKRIKTASKEIDKSDFYDHIVINDDLEKSFKALEGVFLIYKDKVSGKEIYERKGAGT
ncbi:MAG: guanylate kinase [Acidobacteriota bacterium]